MSLRLRLLLGPLSPLVAQVLSVASLVALISGGLSISNLLSALTCGAQCLQYAALINSLAGEFGGLFRAWLIPVWVVLAVSMYFVSVDSARTLHATMTTIGSLGGQGSTLRGLFLSRHLILSTAGLLLGMSLGLVVSQVGLRVAAVFSSAPYEIPVLTPVDILAISAIVYAAALLGCLVPLLRIGRSGPAGGAQQ